VQDNEMMKTVSLINDDDEVLWCMRVEYRVQLDTTPCRT